MMYIGAKIISNYFTCLLNIQLVRKTHYINVFNFQKIKIVLLKILLLFIIIIIIIKYLQYHDIFNHKHVYGFAFSFHERIGNDRSTFLKSFVLFHILLN